MGWQDIIKYFDASLDGYGHVVIESNLVFNGLAKANLLRISITRSWLKVKIICEEERISQAKWLKDFA